VSEFEGDPQEYVTLTGDDMELTRIPVPRVWHLPGQPARGVQLRDRFGLVWKRPDDDADFVDLWHAKETEPRVLSPMQWHRLLGMRGPLTEVL
jgi:hypothetical protein